jgi:hypothetical protein
LRTAAGAQAVLNQPSMGIYGVLNHFSMAVSGGKKYPKITHCQSLTLYIIGWHIKDLQVITHGYTWIISKYHKDTPVATLVGYQT